jgi:cysteinyl-tRNA synthetase
MHAEFLLMNNAKMAKSSGGFVKLADLIEKGFSPLDYKYHCFTAHYRKQLDFSWESLEASKTSRRRLAEAARELANAASSTVPGDYSARLREALSDDLNAPAALAVVWDALKADIPDGAKRAFLLEAEEVFALGLFRVEEMVAIPPDVAALMEQRSRARTAKDFAESDRLRKAIEELGWLVKDGKDGAKAVKK